MAGRTRKDPDTRKKEIIDVARDLISESGHEKVSVSEVARRVGISKAAVYFYFDSKEALFREVIYQEVKGPMEAAEEVFPLDIPLHEKMAKILAISFSLKVNRSKNINKLIDTADGTAGDLVNEDIKRYLAMFTDLFTQAQETGAVDLNRSPGLTPRLAAELLVTATHGVIIAGSPKLATESLESKVTHLVNCFLDGLRPR